MNKEKEGKWENTEKEHTNLKETFEEYGTVPKTGQGRRTDLENLYQMIKDGYSNVEILEINPDNILNLQHIDKARLEILYNRYKAERRTNLLVTYVYGKTGYGKSRDILDSHGDINVYRTTDYKHPFDTYSGEDVLVFEEFRSDLPIGNMLNYLDIYPSQLPARYNNRQACYNFVYIVSNWKLEDQYHNIRLEQKETYEAFLRRIKRVRGYLEKRLLRDLYREYDFLADEEDMRLVNVLEEIYAETGRKFIFLIDEWDCVIRERQESEEMQRQYLDFLRWLLKDRSYVALAYMTGILPVKKYGKHSALNMFWEYSMTDQSIFEEYTGFTEEEVRGLCERYDMDFSEMSSWYDGYVLRRFKHIYNPRSVVGALRHGYFSNYWTSTETYEALKIYMDME